MYVKKLLPRNVPLYALSHYDSIHAISMDDFYDDLRLFKKINTQLKKDCIRQIMNSIIICNNLFNSTATARLLFYYVDPVYHSKLVSILIYLKLMPSDVPELDVGSIKPDPDYNLRLLVL